MKSRLLSFVFLFIRSTIDRYFGIEFESETKCIESDEEPVATGKENFLQINCYIDKDVKYLATGLSNVSKNFCSALAENSVFEVCSVLLLLSLLVSDV